VGAILTLSGPAPVGASPLSSGGNDTPVPPESAVEGLVQAGAVSNDSVSMLRTKHGLSSEQIVLMISSPTKAIVWTDSTTTSANVQVGAEIAGLPKGRVGASAPVAAAATSCGWAITNHAGTTFNVLSAMLTTRTDFCWSGGVIVGTPVVTHSAYVTFYGSVGGWSTSASYDGTLGFIGAKYRTEAKTNWSVRVACVPFIGCATTTGTAYSRHLVIGGGFVTKTNGGWP
jgi:hypothetical protein